jgi:hypothetical protein
LALGPDCGENHSSHWSATWLGKASKITETKNILDCNLTIYRFLGPFHPSGH